MCLEVWRSCSVHAACDTFIERREMSLQSMPVARRLMLILAIALMGLVALAAGSLYERRADMEAGYERSIRGHVEVAHGIVTHYHGLEQSGAMTRDEAQAAAKAALRGLRYEGNE